jgi:hypothetical protein
MTNDKQSNDDTYAGPSKAVEVLGKSNAYGWAGSLTGLTIGAIIGVFGSSYGESVSKWLNNLMTNKSVGKKAIIVTSAFAFSQIGHWTGAAIGARAGIRKVGKGHEQFKRIKTELDQTKAELETIKSERDAMLQDDTKVIEIPNAAHREQAAPRSSIHADAITAEKETAPQLAR